MKPINKQTVKTPWKFVIVGILIGALIGAFFMGVFAQAPSSTFTISSGVYPGAPSYTVWTEGSEYFAKDANGRLAYSGTDATAVIQASLDASTIGGVWNFLAGNYSILEPGLTIKGNYPIRFSGQGIGNTFLVNGGVGYCMLQIGVRNSAGGSQDFTGQFYMDNIAWDGAGANINIMELWNKDTTPGRFCWTSCFLTNAGTGTILCQNMNGRYLEDTVFIDCKFSHTGYFTNMNQPTSSFIHCMFSYMIKAVKIWGNTQVSFDGSCVFSHNTIDVELSEITGVIYVNPISFNGVWFEDCDQVSVTSSSSNNTIRSMSFKDCHMHMGAGASYHLFLDCVNSSITMENCLFIDHVPVIYVRPAQNNKFITVNCPDYVTVNSGTANFASNTTTTFNHGLVGTPWYVWASFSSAAVTGWTWTATSTQITITVAPSGTYIVCWKAEYYP